MKKRFVIITLIGILLTLNLISAINLEIKVKPISNAVILDLNEPAVFELTIKNLEEKDTFKIYSLIGIDISPKSSFILDSNESKTIRIKIMPQKFSSIKKGIMTFEYIISNLKDETLKQTLTINIINLKEAFSITTNNINPKSQNIIIFVENKLNLDFNKLEIKILGAFFEYKDKISFRALETKQFNIPIDKEKLKSLDAGQYLINTQIKINGKTANKENLIKFLAQEDIETIERKEGLIIKRYEITKNNLGNTRKTIKINVQKNLISYLFTTVNIPPTKTQIKGFTKQYIWEKELIPNEEFRIIIKTNWFYPIIIIILIIFIVIFIKKSVEKDLILRKKVSFVQTKGGQFALKITLRLKAKKFIERINIIDKLPPLVKLYEKYGVIAPDKVDLKNRRIEWNIVSLNKDEERIFTYIIYSKIGIVGKFELPEARAIYEKQGKLNQTNSNRSFFINEPKNKFL